MNRGGVSSAFIVFGRLFIGCLFYIGIVSANSIDNLQPGEWYEIPNSDMRAVVMDPLPAGVYAVEGPSAVIHSWSGGALDSQRDRLLVFGGGHTAYAGNEVYAFDLNSLSWERLTDPSSIAGFDNTTNTYPDGNPVSVHSYDQLEYDPFADKLFAFGGSMYKTGSNTRGSFTFNPNTNTWTQVSEIPGKGYSEILGLSLTSAYDPESKKIYVGGAWGIATYDVATDVWQILNVAYGTWALPNGLTAALDYKRRKFIQIGRGYSFIWDISQAKPSREILVTTGQTEILGCDAPGVDYDPVSDRIVAWCNGQDVYTLNLDDLVWEKHIATGTVDPGDPYTKSNYHGTFGRFRYVPSKNVFVLVSDIDKNVYVYKLSPGSGAPTVPQNLSATAVSDSQIDLAWSSSLGGSGLSGYHIYRDSVLLTTVTTNTFSNTGLSAGTLYTYNVTALDGNGDESGPSLPASATTADLPVDTGSSGTGSSGTGASGAGSSSAGSSGAGSIGWFILLIALAQVTVRKFTRDFRQH